jgi:two-component system phosphate regulon response regulator PhoB
MDVNPLRILIVEDDARIADLVSKNLTAAGYECHQSPDGGRALADFARLKPALIVLDVGLGGLDGLEVTRRIRKESDVPILMVTARSSESDKLLGLEIGADDYITKPFSVRELVLRLRAVLRRATAPAPERPPDAIGPIKVDVEAHRAFVDEGEVTLTPLEFRLLTTLMSRAGRVQSREQLLTDVWEMSSELETRTVDTHVKRLREKLGSARDLLETVRGVGCRLIDPTRR